MAKSESGRFEIVERTFPGLERVGRLFGKTYPTRAEARRTLSGVAANAEHRFQTVTPSAATFRAHQGYDGLEIRDHDGRTRRYVVEMVR